MVQVAVIGGLVTLAVFVAWARRVAHPAVGPHALRRPDLPLREPGHLRVRHRLRADVLRLLLLPDAGLALQPAPRRSRGGARPAAGGAGGDGRGPMGCAHRPSSVAGGRLPALCHGRAVAAPANGHRARLPGDLAAGPGDDGHRCRHGAALAGGCRGGAAGAGALRHRQRCQPGGAPDGRRARRGRHGWSWWGMPRPVSPTFTPCNLTHVVLALVTALLCLRVDTRPAARR